MYQIANVSPEQISKIKIANQQKIRELTGSELDLLKAFQLIKTESKGFTNDDEKAMEADKLFYELLKKNNIKTDDLHTRKGEISDDARLRLQERERIRMLTLLELELQLTNSKE